MPFIASHDAPVFQLHGATFTGLAAPSRGATENAVWKVTVAGGSAGVRHRLTREETLVVLAGAAVAHVGGQRFELTAGSALVVPAETDFALDNPGADPFQAVAVLPVGGQVQIGDAPTFTPPWAA